MKLKYYAHELARDVACGKSVDYLLKKYKPFKLGKTMLKRMLEDQEFQMIVKEINDKIDDKLAETRKRLILMSDKALDVIQEKLDTGKLNKEHTDLAVDVVKMSGIGDKQTKDASITLKIIKDEPKSE